MSDLFARDLNMLIHNPVAYILMLAYCSWYGWTMVKMSLAKLEFEYKE